MGEIADMMIEGILCEGCGVFLDGESGGFPRQCSSCDLPPSAGSSTSEIEAWSGRQKERDFYEDGEKVPVTCSICGKKGIALTGLDQHQKYSVKCLEVQNEK